MNNRRKFLASCSTVAAAGLVPSHLLAAGVSAVPFAGRGGGPLAERLRALVGASFRLVDPLTGARATARLSEVRDGPAIPRTEQFSLVFSGDAAMRLDEGIYQVIDPEGRSTDLFLAAGDGEAGARRLRADFCLLA